MQNFTKCSGSRVIVLTDKNSDNAENNTVVTTMGSNNTDCVHSRRWKMNE